MRDCVFLFADAEMQAAFQEFFSRQSFELTLETGPFSVDPAQDFLRDAAGKDSGVYLRAHEFLRPYQTSHRHAVVVLDEKWEGSTGAGKIREDIRQRLRSSGWADERFAVVVIEPELENWIWQDNPHI